MLIEATSSFSMIVSKIVTLCIYLTEFSFPARDPSLTSYCIVILYRSDWYTKICNPIQHIPELNGSEKSRRFELLS